MVISSKISYLPKRICIAGNRFYLERQGGVEIQTKYIGDILAEDGWEVYYLVHSVNRKTGRERLGANKEVCWYPPVPFVFQHPSEYIKSFFDDIKPSVIYQRGRSLLALSQIPLTYAIDKKIKYVFGFSSDTDAEIMPSTKYGLKSDKSFLKKGLIFPYNLMLDYLLRNVLKKSDWIILQNEYQLKKVRQFNKHLILLKTLHPELYKPVIKSSENIIVWVTNYRPWKQGELFIDLARKCKDQNCHFIMIYGSTKKKYVEPLLKNAQKNNNLTIMGETSQEKVEEFIEKSIIFINTSQLCEGFPNTFVQSWLRETPVVSLYVDPGGVLRRENIGRCSGDFEQMVRDVKYLINNKAERIEIGKRARAYAEKEHGLFNNKSKLIDFFNGIIQRHDF